MNANRKDYQTRETELLNDVDKYELHARNKRKGFSRILAILSCAATSVYMYLNFSSPPQVKDKIYAAIFMFVTSIIVGGLISSVFLAIASINKTGLRNKLPVWLKAIWIVIALAFPLIVLLFNFGITNR